MSVSAMEERVLMEECIVRDVRAESREQGKKAGRWTFFPALKLPFEMQI
jgi:hypothetical protein